MYEFDKCDLGNKGAIILDTNKYWWTLILLYNEVNVPNFLQHDRVDA